MAQLYECYYSKEELRIIASKHNIPTEYFSEFENYINKEIEEDYKDENLNIEENKLTCIKYSIEKITKLYTSLNSGHSRLWADLYANNYLELDNEAFDFAYSELKIVNLELANKELLIHCKSNNYDDLYTKYFMKLMLYENFLNADKIAKEYSKLYKEQIIKGKSELFAEIFSELRCYNEYTLDYCLKYAETYCNAIIEGKSTKYAEIYANKISDSFYNYSYWYGKESLIDDENFEYEKIKIQSFMKGWEYAISNHIENIECFINLYNKIYLESYFPDKLENILPIKNLEEYVLNKVFEKFNNKTFT